MSNLSCPDCVDPAFNPGYHYSEEAGYPVPVHTPAVPHPPRWRRWWRVFGLILVVLRWLPIAEWRREQWAWRLDIWGMDHFGRKRL